MNLNIGKKLGGKGSFAVEVVAQKLLNNASIGIVKIAVGLKNPKIDSQTSQSLISKWLDSLAGNDLLPMPMPIQSGVINLDSDSLIHAGKDMYLVNPLSKHLWLKTQAIRDAHRIVSSIQVSYVKINNAEE